MLIIALNIPTQDLVEPKIPAYNIFKSIARYNSRQIHSLVKIGSNSLPQTSMKDLCPFPKMKTQTLVHDGGKLLYLPSIREISLPANFTKEWFRKCRRKLIDKLKVSCLSTVASQLIVTFLSRFSLLLYLLKQKQYPVLAKAEQDVVRESH